MDNQAEGTTQAQPRDDFTQQVKVVLACLYDPMVLGRSPFLSWLDGSAQPDPVKGLRQLIIDAIEALRPFEGTPRGLKSSRVYEILRQRFIEQQTQRRVAENIGMSKRQLQREEKLAIETLCDSLRRAHPQGEPPAAQKQEKVSAQVQAADAPEPFANLEVLRKSALPQPTTLFEEVQQMLQTLHRAARENQVKIHLQPEEQAVPADLFLPAPILRQGLLSTAGTLITIVRGGEISVAITRDAGEAQVKLFARPAPSQKIEITNRHQDSLSYAAKLINLCNGTFQINEPGLGLPGETTDGNALSIEISLPVAEQLSVLFVEDNADTLELYRRYLLDTPYQFIGVHSVYEGLAVAEEIMPKVVVLDVMMPGRDGWTFLNQLLMHPKTEHTAVIVCSVLQQENLALTLGAAGFLQKPVTQADLLAALDRQAAKLATKPGTGP